MGYLNYQFFEEFKRLDKLCRDIYGSDSGNRLAVTLYLEDMDARAYSGRRLVPTWDEDYARLKKLRNLRNGIAHDTSFSEKCTQGDVDFIKDFYSRIINEQDPLSLLRKKTAEKQAKTAKKAEFNVKKAPETTRPDFYGDFNRDEDRRDGLIFAVIAAVAVAVILVITFASKFM